MAGSVQEGKKRQVPTAARVAARVAALHVEAEPKPHVTPLNPGFFALERMRSLSIAKERGKKRSKVHGK